MCVKWDEEKSVCDGNSALGSEWAWREGGVGEEYRREGKNLSISSRLSVLLVYSCL